MTASDIMRQLYRAGRRMARPESQEIHCHNCNQWVQFVIDMELDGNHELHCPNCDHIHYRVVERGKITDIRWRSSMQTYAVTNATTTNYTVFSAGGGGSTINAGLIYYGMGGTGTTGYS